MKIYVVTTGSYSDYRVVAVAETPEIAEKVKARYNDANDIEVYDTDEALKMSKRPEPKIIYYISFIEDGAIVSIAEFLDEEGDEEPKEQKIIKYKWGEIIWSGHAKDKEHAIKLATERRIIFLAEESQVGAKKK